MRQGGRLASGPALQLRHFAFLRDFHCPFEPPGPGHLHIWHATPTEDALPIHDFAGFLSEDEHQRMSRLHFQRDRHAFAFARGMLRLLLGRYLDVAPEEVRFRYLEHGKPALAGPPSESQLQFNLSHTNGYVLLGVCQRVCIGIDVERVRPDIDIDEVGERFFSAAEQRSLRSFPPRERHRAFFHCWTRKESLLKAKGGGLLLPLKDFDVSVVPDESVIRLITRPDATEAQRWHILPVSVPEAYAAAVCVSV
jgi:4'-phosphopantetheinyl transferase